MENWIRMVLVLVHLREYIYGLRLLEVKIPKHIIKDNTATLECSYDLDGEALYSVKWYKDGNEFYRYVPREDPPILIFSRPDVTVDSHNSTDTLVILKKVNLTASGRYRCEVSAEAPSFQTVSDHGDMVVLSLPDKGPSISGGKARYQIGDTVRVNCTSGRSKPAVSLSWYVNTEPAPLNMLRYYDNKVTGREGLETSVLGLEFRVEQHHFKNGDMKLKCVAQLSTIYWRSNEESVEGDKPVRTPALESKETFSFNSRADPVQANNSKIVAPNTITTLLTTTSVPIIWFLFITIIPSSVSLNR